MNIKKVVNRGGGAGEMGNDSHSHRDTPYIRGVSCYNIILVIKTVLLKSDVSGHF